MQSIQMKTKIFTLLGAMMLAFGLTGCSDDPNYITEKTGSVRLSDLGCEVSTDEIVLARADASEVNTDPFLVKIFDASGKEVYSSTFANRNEIVTLPVATGYTLRVESHEVQNTDWEAPYYAGEKKFDIKENEITPIGTVNCSFKNIRVSVRYSDRLKKLMATDCKVDVSCSDWDAVMTFSHNETRSAYFKELKLSKTLGATFSGTVNGQKVTLTKALDNVEAGQHRIITFDVKGPNTDVPDENGSVTMSGQGDGIKIGDGLYLSATITTLDINGNINVDEKGDGNAQRPGQEDPSQGDDPGPAPADDPITITSSTLSFTSVMNPADYASAIVNISCTAGTAHLRVKIATDNQNFEASIVEMGIPLDFDLAYVDPSSKDYTQLGLLGFPMNEQIIGNTAPVFDITNFVPLLAGFSGTHTFTLDVEDANGNRLAKTLTFKV